MCIKQSEFNSSVNKVLKNRTINVILFENRLSTRFTELVLKNTYL